MERQNTLKSKYIVNIKKKKKRQNSINKYKAAN